MSNNLVSATSSMKLYQNYGLKRMPYLFSLIVGFSFCKSNHKSRKESSQELNIHYNSKSIKDALKDSLDFYSDSLGIIKVGDRGEYSFIVQKINNQRLGIIAVTDSTIWLFKNQNDVWLQTDSLKFTDFLFDYSIVDLNGDNIQDLVIYGQGNMHGQSIPYVFISDKSFHLQYRPDIKLYNIRFDPNKKIVKSFYIGGVYSTIRKESYQWVNDSLVLLQGVQRDYIDNFTFITTFYRLKNGRRYEYKKEKDNDSKIYDNALWDESF